MRFAKIEGTAVRVDVTSAEEAKAAVKELRHKRREMKFLRSALARQQKAARAKKKRGRWPKSFIPRLMAARDGYVQRS
jgi:hypothetical protein